MAALRVFDILELLEMVLLGLPVKYILAVKSIDTTWKRLIESSVRLRQATFHAPRGRIIHPLRRDISHRPSPLSLEDFPFLQGATSFEVMPLFELKLIGEARYRQIEKFEDLAWYALDLLLHVSASRLTEILANQVNRKYKPNPLYIDGQMVHLLDFNHYDKVEVTLSSAVRSMLITQPAVSAMTIFVAQGHGAPISTATIYALEGITLGLVIDMLMRMVVRIPEPVRNEVGFLMGGSFITESEQSHDAMHSDRSST